MAQRTTLQNVTCDVDTSSSTLLLFGANGLIPARIMRRIAHIRERYMPYIHMTTFCTFADGTAESENLVLRLQGCELCAAATELSASMSAQRVVLFRPQRSVLTLLLFSEMPPRSRATLQGPLVLFSEAPLVSKTGVFTLVLYEGVPKHTCGAKALVPSETGPTTTRVLDSDPSFAPPGVENRGRWTGVSADYTSQPPLVAPASTASPPPPLPARPVVVQGTRAVSVTTAAALREAAADPTVTSIALQSSLALGGTAVVVSGRGRNLTISADPSTCGQAVALLGGVARPTGAGCAIDAGWLSRHFEARVPTSASPNYCPAARPKPSRAHPALSLHNHLHRPAAVPTILPLRPLLCPGDWRCGPAPERRGSFERGGAPRGVRAGQRREPAVRGRVRVRALQGGGGRRSRARARAELGAAHFLCASPQPYPQRTQGAE